MKWVSTKGDRYERKSSGICQWISGIRINHREEREIEKYIDEKAGKEKGVSTGEMSIEKSRELKKEGDGEKKGRKA